MPILGSDRMNEPRTSPRLEEHGAPRRVSEQLPAVAHAVPSLTPAERERLLRALACYLEDEIVPLLRAEEAVLESENARVRGKTPSLFQGSPQADAISEHVRDLAGADPCDVAAIQEQLYAIHALIDLELQGEEEAYLSLRSRASAGEVEHALAQIARRAELSR